ncbi:MAG: hypothetical protein VB092_03270 [Oscillospiraceae bacterium]|nr:hypothetical protein [Oscillospiraceae bacterium]
MIESFIKTWGIALCTAALLAGLLSAAAPDGPLARSLKYILGLYVLLAAITPFIGADSVLNAEASDLFEVDTSGVDAAYDDSVLRGSEAVIEENLQAALAVYGLDAQADVIISMDDARNIYCNRAILYITHGDSARAAEIARAQLGIEPEIIRR